MTNVARTSNQCAVGGCKNTRDAGRFVGDFCAACDNALRTGNFEFGTSHIHTAINELSRLRIENERLWMLNYALLNANLNIARMRRLVYPQRKRDEMKLPKTVFVSVQGDGDDEYLRAEPTAAEHADDSGDTVRVGKYELVEFHDVALKPVIMPVAIPRRLR